MRKSSRPLPTNHRPLFRRPSSSSLRFVPSVPPEEDGRQLAAAASRAAGLDVIYRGETSIELYAMRQAKSTARAVLRSHDFTFGVTRRAWLATESSFPASLGDLGREIVATGSRGTIPSERIFSAGCEPPDPHVRASASSLCFPTCVTPGAPESSAPPRRIWEIHGQEGGPDDAISTVPACDRGPVGPRVYRRGGSGSDARRFCGGLARGEKISPDEVANSTVPVLAPGPSLYAYSIMPRSNGPTSVLVIPAPLVGMSSEPLIGCHLARAFPAACGYK